MNYVNNYYSTCCMYYNDLTKIVQENPWTDERLSYFKKIVSHLP